MGFNAPTVEQRISPERFARERELASHGPAYNATISEQISRLPSFQAWQDSITQGPSFHGSGVGANGVGRGDIRKWHELMADMARAGIQIPEDEMVDGYTGTVRGKSWMERHPVLGAILVGAAVGAGGYGAAAMLGGGGAGAAGAGGLVGSGEAAVSTVPLAGTLGATVPSTIAGATAPTVAGAAGTASTLGTIGKLANVARDVGGAVSNASSAAGANRRTDAQIGQNAQRTYEDALMARAKLESDQRKDAAKDIYRSSFYKNEQTGPYSAKPQAKVSPEFMSSLSAAEQQGLARLKTPPEYDSTKLKPLVERQIDPATGLEKAGSWIGPTLSTIGSLVGSYYGR